jgi:pimeloyl-ACP methyl ester carboxylesterase
VPTIPANGIEICYDDWGPRHGEPLLLVMGLGAQLISWPTGFCSALLAEGFRVIRFDNRDAGLSTKTPGPPPDGMAIIAAASAGEVVATPYSLSDMAADAMAVLDHLKIEAAHVVGSSLGGMIAQTIAIEHHHRVRTLTSIMSTTGNPAVGKATGNAIRALLEPAPAEREAFLDHYVRTGSVLAGGLIDPEYHRTRGAEEFDRCYHPIGSAFQLAAIAATGDRTARLASVTAPTLVIHGGADELIGVDGGHATAAAIPGAELLVIDDMAHSLPEQHWGAIVRAIRRVADRSLVGS